VAKLYRGNTRPAWFDTSVDGQHRIEMANLRCRDKPSSDSPYALIRREQRKLVVVKPVDNLRADETGVDQMIARAI
jgi:hypothetical protein